jgi:hypothetical protein
LSAWNDTEVAYVNKYAGVPIALDRSGEKKINIYRDSLDYQGQKPLSELLLLDFFKLVERTIDESVSRRFTYKFVVADQDAVTGFGDRLKSGTFKRYADIVGDFDKAVDRLVALHLANALISNNLPISEARDLDVRTWSATKDFASCKRYMSLTPLTSAYSPTSIDEDFPSAVAAYLDNSLSCVTESSTKTAFTKLLRALVG